MTIFRLNFLLQGAQVKMCQNPSPISTEVICYNIGFFSEGAPGPSFDQEWQHKPI